MIEIVLWILLTLALVTGTSVVARKYGVEYMIGMYCALIVVANILASKIVVFASFTVPAAVIVYASSFLLTDMLSEFYGKEQARKAVWAGFMANIMLVVSVYIAIIWQGAPFWENQSAFETVLKNTPRIVAASMIAYLVSQHHDVISYHWWKKRFPEHLWLRNNASTVVSQALDTVIFISLAFYGIFPIGTMIVGQYVVKLLIALLDTPFIYTVKKAGYTRP
ncbi:MAG: queuosine precursor transporter [Theionarchaea archaeon]|nr:queuosine precursor transporter [Theionarchaea archaeon]